MSMYIYIYAHQYTHIKFRMFLPAKHQKNLARYGRMAPDTRALGEPDNFMVRAGGTASKE